MPDVYCDVTDCAYNKSGTCDSGNISLDYEGVCETREDKKPNELE